jgi:hypothetical protein
MVCDIFFFVIVKHLLTNLHILIGMLMRPVESLTTAGASIEGPNPAAQPVTNVQGGEKPRRRLVMSNEPAVRKKIRYLTNS